MASTRKPNKTTTAGTAAAQVHEADHLTLNVPLLGELHLPRADNMAYYAGVGTLVVLGILEWPAALVLGAGHVLLTQQRNRALQQFGEALEDG